MSESTGGGPGDAVGVVEGVALCVCETDAVAEPLVVLDWLPVAEPEGVPESVRDCVRDWLGERVGLCVGLRVREGVCERVGVGVRDELRVPDGDADWLADGDSEAVSEGDCDCEGELESVPEALGVPVAERLGGGGVRVRVALRVAVELRVGVAVAVFVEESVAVSDAVLVAVAVAVSDEEDVAEADAEEELEAELDAELVDVRDDVLVLVKEPVVEGDVPRVAVAVRVDGAERDAVRVEVVDAVALAVERLDAEDVNVADAVDVAVEVGLGDKEEVSEALADAVAEDVGLSLAALTSVGRSMRSTLVQSAARWATWRGICARSGARRSYANAARQTKIATPKGRRASQRCVEALLRASRRAKPVICESRKSVATSIEFDVGGAGVELRNRIAVRDSLAESLSGWPLSASSGCAHPALLNSSNSRSADRSAARSSPVTSNCS